MLRVCITQCTTWLEAWVDGKLKATKGHNQFRNPTLGDQMGSAFCCAGAHRFTLHFAIDRVVGLMFCTLQPFVDSFSICQRFGFGLQACYANL